MTIKVLLADDHAVVRDGIKAVVERMGHDIEIIGEASNGNEVLKLAKESPADVYVIDITMPVLNGLETTERLTRQDPNSRVIILSMHDDRSFVEKAFQCGAKGYVIKDSVTEEVLQAIREVYRDRFFLSPKVSRFIVQGFLGAKAPPSGDAKSGSLTGRERQILQLIAEGFSNKEIARQLDLSINTVHVHRKNIMRKLGLHRQADLIRYAIKEGITQV